MLETNTPPCLEAGRLCGRRDFHTFKYKLVLPAAFRQQEYCDVAPPYTSD